MSEVPLSRESLSGWQGEFLALSVDGAIPDCKMRV